MPQRFRELLKREFAARRRVNPRWSLRAFAALLGADHSTLSQVLRGKRRLPVRSLRQWAKRLGLAPEEVVAYVAAEHLPDPHVLAREAQLLHWTAEATALMTESVHWHLFDACQYRAVRPDARRFAARFGVSADEVNIAFSRLLRLGLLSTDSQGRWKSALGRRVEVRSGFQRTALARVRALAAKES